MTICTHYHSGTSPRWGFPFFLWKSKRSVYSNLHFYRRIRNIPYSRSHLSVKSVFSIFILIRNWLPAGDISTPTYKKNPERAWDWDKNAQLFLNGITKSSFHTLTQSFQKRDFVAAVQRCVDKVHKCRQSDTTTFGNIAASAVISLYQHLCTYIKPPSNRNSAGTYLGGYSKNFPQRCGFIIGSGFPDARNSTT